MVLRGRGGGLPCTGGRALCGANPVPAPGAGGGAAGIGFPAASRRMKTVFVLPAGVVDDEGVVEAGVDVVVGGAEEDEGIDAEVDVVGGVNGGGGMWSSRVGGKMYSYCFSCTHQNLLTYVWALPGSRSRCAGTAIQGSSALVPGI